jgi:hypothetical protein
MGPGGKAANPGPYHMATTRASPAWSRLWPSGVDLNCLYGVQSDWANSTVIVPAVFREWHGHGPPEWLHSQYPVYLYQRRNATAPCYCANRGYESAVYFTFIARHYTHLPAFVAFVQGDWIFATKTSAGAPFRFWQPRCVSGEAASSAPWAAYLPLGGRRSVWPPRCVVRQTSFYSRFVGRQRGPLVEACVRELLHVLGFSGHVRPYARERPLNITFYTNMNFLASRARLRRYRHHAYRVLASRFVEEGVCVPSTSGTSAGSDVLLAHNVSDGPQFAKFTLGMATELLQQGLYGDGPLECGPPPAVPLDEAHCLTPAPTVCT